ncbi:hypothetical protein MPER_11300 [Moniliophthora perniciosa FA553]|nr:hypothetical protein MPER_11300 [Moniliophthora perniciosa FA553]
MHQSTQQSSESQTWDIHSLSDAASLLYTVAPRQMLPSCTPTVFEVKSRPLNRDPAKYNYYVFICFRTEETPNALYQEGIYREFALVQIDSIMSATLIPSLPSDITRQLPQGKVEQGRASFKGFHTSG